MSSPARTLPRKPQRTLAQRMWDARYIYLILLPGIIYFLVIHYYPMYGLVLAFKKYSAKLGIWGSQWVGFAHFERIFSTPAAVRSIVNTLQISFWRLVFQFPAPILLALLLNEMPEGKCKKFYQTVYTFPHFLSWVVVGTLITNLLSNTGTINLVLKVMNLPQVEFLAEKGLARPLLYITANWKGMGWSSIIYMAAISGIDPALYEAATIDGANRVQRIVHVTLPCIMSTIVVLFILEVGNIMNNGFEQIFNVRNGVTKSTLDILDTYIYDITFEAMPNFGFSTAVGLFKSVCNLFMLIVANLTVKKISGQGLFGGGDD